VKINGSSNIFSIYAFSSEDLAISADSPARFPPREQDPGPLPMILWQYGLITLEQIDQNL